jgi:hypothetical protein
MIYSPPLLSSEERTTLDTKAANKLYQERLRERRVEMGVCRVCGKHPPAEGKIDCRFCSARSAVNAADRAAKRFQRLRISGMCTQCGKSPAIVGKVKCADCTAKYAPKDRVRHADRRSLFAEQGLCRGCGAEPQPDRTYCSVCVAKRSKSGKAWRTNAKKKAVDYLGGACQDCGFKTDILTVYDFHHRDPAIKDFTIAKFINADFAKVVAPELDKCDLLCANCHRIRHATNPSFEEQDEEVA